MKIFVLHSCLRLAFADGHHGRKEANALVEVQRHLFLSANRRTHGRLPQPIKFCRIRTKFSQLLFVHVNGIGEVVANLLRCEQRRR